MVLNDDRGLPSSRSRVFQALIPLRYVHFFFLFIRKAPLISRGWMGKKEEDETRLVERVNSPLYAAALNDCSLPLAGASRKRELLQSVVEQLLLATGREIGICRCASS